MLRNKQIGWENKEILTWEISKKLSQLNSIAFKLTQGDFHKFPIISTSTTSTSTTTIVIITTSTTTEIPVTTTTTSTEELTTTTTTTESITGYPSLLSSNSYTDTQIELIWTNNSVSGYDTINIERGLDGISFVEISTISIPSVRYLDTGLTSGVLYFYRIRYSKGSQYSEYSEQAEITTKIVRILTDGNTTAIFVYDENSTITKDGSNLVSEFKDFLNQAGSKLTASGTLRPTHQSDGILFNGTTNRLKGAFTLVQPEVIYGNLKQITWGSSRYIFDGYSANDPGANNGCVQQFSASPQLLAYAGIVGSTNNNLAIDQWGILRVTFNGASSKIQVNETTPVTGNFGAANMNGLSIGGFAGINVTSPAPYSANIKVKEFIIRKVVEPTNDSKIYNYLKNKTYSTPKTLTTPTVVFNFDDGFGRWSSKLLPVLQNKNVKATFYVLCGLVNFDNPYPGILDAYGGESAVTPPLQWSDLRNMYAAGMDIQAHAFYQHTNMTALTDAQIRSDFDSMNSAFYENGLPIPRHMSYPGGYNNAHLNNIVWEYFNTGRTVDSAYGDANTNRFKIPVNLGVGIDGESVSVLNAAKANIDYAVANNKFVVFYAHDFYLDTDTRVNTISTKQFIVEGIIDYAILQGCNIKTMSELYTDLWE